MVGHALFSMLVNFFTVSFRVLQFVLTGFM